MVHNKCSKITVLYLKKKGGCPKREFLIFKLFFKNVFIKFLNFFFFVFVFCKMFTYMAHQWAITKLSYMYFISKRDPNSEISHNWKIHNFFYFSSFMCFFILWIDCVESFHLYVNIFPLSLKDSEINSQRKWPKSTKFQNLNIFHPITSFSL